jgi:integrase
MARPQDLKKRGTLPRRRANAMKQAKSVPSYRKHRQSGQAVVTLPDGLGRRHDILLGKYGTQQSRLEYSRVITEWEVAGRSLPQSPDGQDLTINELILAYCRFAEGYYRKNGQPTTQLDRVRRSLRPVKELYRHTPAKDFGPLALKAVRVSMVKNGWARGYINSCIGCVKRMFKWGVENELLPASTNHALQTVPGLKRGRSEARESQPIRPVPDAQVKQTLVHLNRPCRAMVQLQRLTGMRPCEVVIIRPSDVDRSDANIWIYRPESHKTEHHNLKRNIYFGPRAQEVLRPFLLRNATAYCFSPKEAMLAFRAEQRAKRKTKVQPSQLDRRKARPRKGPGDRYTVDSYRRSIQEACLRAGMRLRVTFAPGPAATVSKIEAFAQEGVFLHGLSGTLVGRFLRRTDSELGVLHGRCEKVFSLIPGVEVFLDGIASTLDHLRPVLPLWHPNQLRHSMATEVRREAGLDAARVVLGHRSPATTEIYAEVDSQKAAEVMARLG